MKIEIDLSVQDLIWENNASLIIKKPSQRLIVIDGNKEGLISLAKQLLTIAYSDQYICAS